MTGTSSSNTSFVGDSRALGESLCERYSAEERAWLAAEPSEAIPALTDLSVQICEPEEFGSSNCSVEGLYLPQRRHITVMRTGRRRTKFTLLHELGHDHARRTDATAELLAGMTRGSVPYEERIADAFAAEILVPSAEVEAVLEGRSPTAADVADLCELVEGSMEACCVRMAQHLGAGGYVLLAEGSVVRFCAVAGDTYRIRRGTDQGADHLLAIAARHGSASADQVRLYHRSGVRTREYGGDAVSRGDLAFAVLTEATNPPWGGWRPPGDARPLGVDLLCGGCDQDVVSWKRCETCGGMVCPRGECGWCLCRGPGRAVVAERVCARCFLTKRFDLFPDDGDTCRDCS